MENKKAIAMYIRLSMEDRNVDGVVKVESNSVEAQRNLILSYISRMEEFRGYDVIEFADDGFSGTNFERPRFQEMMRQARLGNISVIVVKDFSRFGRDYLEVGNFLERILPVMGIRFISVNDGFDSDNCQGMTGGMSVALKNILNAMYSQDLSVKVKSAMKTHVQNGEYIAAFTCYGYVKNPEDTHRLMIDESVADTVRLVFAMAADGVPKTQICRYLNEAGIDTPGEHMNSLGVRKTTFRNMEKKLWTVTTISDMLRNETYLGKCVFNRNAVVGVGARRTKKLDRDSWTIVEGTHEPIISEKLFKEANENGFPGEKRKHPPERVYALCACAYCGRAMCSDKYRRDYRCRTAYQSGNEDCKANKINKDRLETAILESARKMAELLLTNIEKKKEQYSRNGQLTEQLKAYEKEKTRMSSRKIKIYDAYRNGSTSREVYMQELEELKYRLAELDSMIADINRQLDGIRELAESMKESESKFHELAALETFDKAVLSKLIKKVYIYGPDKIEIIWKADDIFQEMSLDEKEIVVPSTGQ